MHYVISIGLTVFSGALLYIVQKLIDENKKLRDEKKKENKTKQDAIANGVLELLRIQLIEYHDKYMDDEDIPTYAYENFDEMYKAYEALGGNGTVKKMKEDIDHLRLGGSKRDKQRVY